MKEPKTMFTMGITQSLRHQIREAAAKHDQEMAPWVINAVESYLKFVEPSLPRSNPRVRKHETTGPRKKKVKIE